MQDDRRIQTICLLVLTIIGVCLSMYWLRPVLVPFVLAVFIALILRPMVGWLQGRSRLGKPVAVAVVLVLCLSVFLIVGGVASAALGQMISSAGEYQARVETLLKQASMITFPSAPLQETAISAALPFSKWYCPSDTNSSSIGGFCLWLTRLVVEPAA